MADGSLESARAAKKRAFDLFSKLGDVVGIGLTKIDDGYGLKINFSSPPNDPAAVPDDVDGVPVKVEVVGAIRKRPAS
jgi:diaminopimelate decarboxylase